MKASEPTVPLQKSAERCLRISSNVEKRRAMLLQRTTRLDKIEPPECGSGIDRGERRG